MDDHTSDEAFPYERIEEIGDGGIGTVYRAEQTRLGREVAVKEINNLFDIFADLKRSDIVHRFTNVVQEQAALSHPHIVQVLDLISETEYPYVVTEYAPNGNIRRLIESEDERSLNLALKYFVQILHGLNAAHKQGVVHGSIKPENVLLDPAGNACLSDFGVSRLVDLSGTTDQVYVGVGSVAYMPPEQIQNPTDVTVESDIYALGILFYELLTGKVPGRRSPMPSSFYPEIPRALDDIFDRMSMDVAEDRYASIDDILVDFYSADAIVDLLDRETGVVFLRDPVQHGEARFTGGDDGEEAMAADGGESGDASDDEPFVREDTDSGRTGIGEEAQESSPDAPADDASASELSGESSGAELGDDSSPPELGEKPSDAESEETSSEKKSDGLDGDEPSTETTEASAEDEEVLDKLDEYGELFED